MPESSSELFDVVLKRHRVLKCICENGPDKRDLVNDLSVSRSTVDRAVRELENSNLISRTNGVCEPTFTGKVAIELCFEFVTTFRALEESITGHSELSADSSLDKSIFLGADFYHPSDFAPYEKIEPMHRDLANGDAIVAVSGILIPYLREALVKGTIDDVELSLFLSEDAIDVLLENNPGEIMPHIETGDRVYTDIDLPKFSLFLINEDVLYTVFYSRTNHLSSVIRSTNCQAIRWMNDFVSDLRGRGTLLTA